MFLRFPGCPTFLGTREPVKVVAQMRAGLSISRYEIRSTEGVPYPWRVLGLSRFAARSAMGGCC